MKPFLLSFIIAYFPFHQLTSLSKVYREVSPEEYLAYTTEETEKIKVQTYAARHGGNMQKGIAKLVAERIVARVPFTMPLLQSQSADFIHCFREISTLRPLTETRV